MAELGEKIALDLHNPFPITMNVASRTDSNLGYNGNGVSLLRCSTADVTALCHSPCVIGATLHLTESCLVQGTGVNVDDVAVS